LTKPLALEKPAYLERVPETLKDDKEKDIEARAAYIAEKLK